MSDEERPRVKRNLCHFWQHRWAYKETVEERPNLRPPGWQPCSYEPHLFATMGETVPVTRMGMWGSTPTNFIEYIKMAEIRCTKCGMPVNGWPEPTPKITKIRECLRCGKVKEDY